MTAVIYVPFWQFVAASYLLVCVCCALDSLFKARRRRRLWDARHEGRREFEAWQRNGMQR